jgi:hypothetical protein
MSDKSINEACRECPEIRSLLERARTDEGAKRELEAHAVRYISSLLECIETYDDCVDYQADIHNSLQRIADSSRRRADLYQELADSSMQTLKRVAEMIPEIVNGAVNRVVSELIEKLNDAGVLAGGLGLERGEPLEFMKPISVDLDIAEVQGALKLSDSPKLTLYTVSRTSILTKTKESLRANRESGILEFKEEFHQEPLSKDAGGAWCEIIKDIVAMANSGGGFILLGLRDDGSVSGKDVAPFVAVDPAKITDKIYSFTGTHFEGFCLTSEYKDGQLIAVLQIEEAPDILVFKNPGNYVDSHGRQKSAFTAGAVYVRHGAKSEPCTGQELSAIISRKALAQVSQSLRGVNEATTSTPTEPGETKPPGQ